MIAFLVKLVVAAVIFVAGVLVGRANPKKVNTVISDVKTDAAKIQATVQTEVKKL